jgi:hypothetical protein
MNRGTPIGPFNPTGGPINHGTPINQGINHGTPIGVTHGNLINHGASIHGPPVHVHHGNEDVGHLPFRNDRKSESVGTPIHSAPCVRVGQPVRTSYVPPVHHHVTPAPAINVGQPIGVCPPTLNRGQPIGVVPEPVVNRGTPIGHVPSSTTVSHGVPIHGTPIHGTPIHGTPTSRYPH